MTKVSHLEGPLVRSLLILNEFQDLRVSSLIERGKKPGTTTLLLIRNDGSQSEISGMRDTPTGRSLYLARPLQIKDAACLSCHTSAAVAPAAPTAPSSPAAKARISSFSSAMWARMRSSIWL